MNSVGCAKALAQTTPIPPASVLTAPTPFIPSHTLRYHRIGDRMLPTHVLSVKCDRKRMTLTKCVLP
jgi:hypothetical protein